MGPRADQPPRVRARAGRSGPSPGTRHRVFRPPRREDVGYRWVYQVRPTGSRRPYEGVRTPLASPVGFAATARHASLRLLADPGAEPQVDARSLNTVTRYYGASTVSPSCAPAYFREGVDNDQSIQHPASCVVSISGRHSLHPGSESLLAGLRLKIDVARTQSVA